jgi:hypothetical protein
MNLKTKYAQLLNMIFDGCIPYKSHWLICEVMKTIHGLFNSSSKQGRRVSTRMIKSRWQSQREEFNCSIIVRQAKIHGSETGHSESA